MGDTSAHRCERAKGTAAAKAWQYRPSEGLASHKIPYQLSPTARKQDHSQVQASWAQHLHLCLIHQFFLQACQNFTKLYAKTLQKLAPQYLCFSETWERSYIPALVSACLIHMELYYFISSDFLHPKLTVISNSFFKFCDVLIHTVSLEDNTSKTLLVIATVAQPKLQCSPHGPAGLYRELYNHWNAPIWNDCSLVLKHRPSGKQLSFHFSSRFKKSFRGTEASPHGGEERHSQSSDEWDKMPAGIPLTGSDGLTCSDCAGNWYSYQGMYGFHLQHQNTAAVPSHQSSTYLPSWSLDPPF